MALRAALLAVLASALALGLAGSDRAGGGAPGASDGAPGAARGAAGIRGPVRVIDADTFEVGGVRVRLHGIDAPERDQGCLDAAGLRFACGDEATAFARSRWGGGQAECDPLGDGGHGRALGRCRVGGEDVAATLALGGYAYAYVRYSRDYVEEEAAARARGAGFFAGRFDPPWEVRSGSADEGAAVPAGASGDCRIKGNVSRNGRVFHVPGSRHYGVTEIDAREGERWFCSEAEALGAGWRAPL